MNRYVVLKFGGTSVSTVARWKTIASQIQANIESGKKPIVVCSAVSGVSNLLEEVIDRAPSGDHAEALAAVSAKNLELVRAMEIDPEVIEGPLAELERLAQGIHLVGEASPRVRARVMACGELMSTLAGAAWLTEQGHDVSWLDARDVLTSREEAVHGARAYLSATCAHDRDPRLLHHLDELGTDAFLTQGFIARNADGDTVVLGRGGSDTSAAYFAAKTGAEVCEIWTDVPGMFTANPRQIPSARLLRRLDYVEAQEIATMGAKVLHPRSIPPVRSAGIPMRIRCTHRPDVEGTTIEERPSGGAPQVKAVAARHGIQLVSMDTVGMWQQVGFLADIFGCFKRFGLSIDLVSTSEMNVTVSLDPSANVLDEATRDRLVESLAAFAETRLIGPTASISLVGNGIRSILGKLGPSLQQFEEHRLHLLTQAASDLNLTVVVDESESERLIRSLHDQLFGNLAPNSVFGPTLDELYGNDEAAAFPDAWWRGARETLLSASVQTPAYVYDLDTLDERALELAELKAVDRVFFAIKANPHPRLLQRLHRRGIGFETVSTGELRRVRELFPDITATELLFTPNFAPREDYELGFELGATVTLDNLEPLERYLEVFEGRDVFLRLDPGRGRGHHDHVRTAGPQSKFGVEPDELERAAELAEKAGARVTGLHAHAGSGIRTPDAWQETALFLARWRELFPDVRTFDVGGGLGIPEKPGQSRLALEALDAGLEAFKRVHDDIEIWMEPGRYLVAECGVVLTRVNQRKQKGDVTYVGVDAGMHTLIRPALYGAYHQIENLSRMGEGPAEVVHIVGPICETGDTLGRARRIDRAEPGDLLVVGTAGAYGRSMSSRYNLREWPSEWVHELGRVERVDDEA